jgi:hypothetical protein
MDDLNAAINLQEEALKLVADDHPDRAIHLLKFADALQARFEQNGLTEDFDRAALAYKRSAEAPQIPSSIRVLSAIRAANLQYSQDLVKNASEMLELAARILPTVTPRTLQRNDQQYVLSQYAGLAADAAALSIQTEGNISKALELLELGRGVMANVYMETRNDITELTSAHSELAERFKSLRDEFDVPEFDPDLPLESHDSRRSRESGIARRYEASKEFDETLERIRTKRGFERFLRGPSSDEVRQLAAVGPIILLNCSRFGCDAFIVTNAFIRHLPLPQLLYSDVKQKLGIFLTALEDADYHANVTLSKTLEWLWNAAVRPVLDELGFIDTPQADEAWPHVWWIPVGPLSLFPVHAAGYHSVPGRSAVDRVISSFIPTVKGIGTCQNSTGTNATDKPAASDRVINEYADHAKWRRTSICSRRSQHN